MFLIGLTILLIVLQGSNVFDFIPTPSSKHAHLGKDEVTRYLATATEETDNPLLWWRECRDIFPCLLCMALDYLSIPGMFFAVIA